jgi:hypothetical protein
MARCGGAQKLAEHLQLPYTETRGRRRREEGLPQQLVQQQLRLHEAGQEAQGQLQQQAQQVQPGSADYLASRRRQPAGLVGAPAAATAAAAPAAPAAAAAAPRRQRQGPATRLAERDLVLEAYTSVDFV